MEDPPRPRLSAARRRLADAGRFGAIAVLAAFLGGCTLTDLIVRSDDEESSATAVAAPTPTLAQPGQVETGLLQVDALDVQVLESFPVQVNVVVSGTLPDGCTEIGRIEQERTGNAVTIEIATVRDPAALCTQALVPIEQTIPLIGDYPAGEYTVTVNGVTATITV